MSRQITLPNWFNSKDAIVKMIKGESLTWWLPIESNGATMIMAIDYLPDNYPELEIVVFEKLKEAQERKFEMINQEEWQVIKDHFDEIVRTDEFTHEIT